MGFSIGRLLGAVAPIIGGIFGGPVGAAIGTSVATAFIGPRGPASPFPVPTGTVGSQRGPTGSDVLVGGSAVLTMARGAVGFIARLLARASATIGKRITRAGVLSLSREVGLVAAATALGLTAVEVAQIIATKPRRRRRGITASQISTTKSTLRRIQSLDRAIAKACPPPAHRRAAIRK